MFRWAYVNKEKVFYCSYKMILNTTSKAGDSSLISSGFNSNDWQKEKLETSHEILHRKNNFGELTWRNKCNYYKVDQKNLFFNTSLSGIWITPSLRRVFKKSLVDGAQADSVSSMTKLRRKKTICHNLWNQFTAGKKKVICRPRVGPCGRGQHFQVQGHSFSLYGPPSRQITYIYCMALYYMVLSQKDWELPNSWIWLAEMDIDRGLDFPI